MNSERQGLEWAILERPTDDTARLVYADWLEEHGDARDQERASLIRLMIAREVSASWEMTRLAPQQWRARWSLRGQGWGDWSGDRLQGVLSPDLQELQRIVPRGRSLLVTRGAIGEIEVGFRELFQTTFPGMGAADCEYPRLRSLVRSFPLTRICLADCCMVPGVELVGGFSWGVLGRNKPFTGYGCEVPRCLARHLHAPYRSMDAAINDLFVAIVQAGRAMAELPLLEENNGSGKRARPRMRQDQIWKWTDEA